ncbi:hypothetical protein PFICI_14158 [Pestalotiopsis fici W106-1]|uniref:Protein kinase domain-containing protein n=1 Tax=Pestalotiopsis fici (strain W106-1 / CGMCC3.15140) TaxID=1229662 RepID=W3WMC6_PESFW|nr:uncharacterized protein PFICI_14158 [Pestalotiopsis fici W106-1]ETS74292.1 hypothetical protein PFICI_14158 [Pestalotiopsis fici W106-1]
MSLSGASSDGSSDDSYCGDVETNDNTSPTGSEFQDVDSQPNKGNTFEPLGEYLATQYEDIELYRPGGLHPIHIGDYLDADQNFEVLHKLGFGSSSTVWLCFDHYSRYYRAVKVFTADTSTLRWYDNPQVQALADRTVDEALPHTIVTPLKKFWVKGHNGKHLCLVLPVLGPNLLDGLEGAGLDTPDYLQDLCRSLAGTVNYLHQNGVIHGDIRPQKIMRVLASQWMWTVSRRDLFGRYIPKPESRKLKPLIRSFAHDGPRYLVSRADLGALEREFRTNRIAIADFGRVSQSSDLLEPTQVHCTGYSAPEVRLKGIAAGAASDVWSLAACLHIVRTGRELLADMNSDTAYLGWLTWVFGPGLTLPINNIRGLLARDGTTLVESNGREEEEVHRWLDRRDKPVSRYRRADSKRTFKRAERTAIKSPISKSNGSTDLDLDEEEVDGDSEASSQSDTSSDGSDNSFVNSRRRSRTRTPPVKPRPEVILPTTYAEWDLLREEHAQRTGFPTLLDKSIGSTETWHEMSESMRSRGLLSSGIMRMRPGSRESTSSSHDERSEKTTSRSRSRSRPPSEAPPELRRSPRIKRPADDEDTSCSCSVKKQRAEEKSAIVVPKIDERDQVSCSETADGMIEYVYKMQSSEVALFADLLMNMLMPDPKRRFTAKQALKHPWFKKRNGNSAITASVEANTDQV